jgi:mono/diheme cytochrome c family protein
VGRMSGPTLADDQVDATLKWIDAQPRPALSPPADPAAVDRGRALFADTARAGCASCHNGDRLTNNQSIDVGTGGTFQVPSLVGIGSRGPYLHDGCAKTLRDRFGACGGGDKHGVTSTLTEGDLSDLVAYLKTL